MSTHQNLHLETIPNEFLGIIVSFLDPPSAHCFGLTNHFFYDTVTAVCQCPFNEICPRHISWRRCPAILQDTVLTDAEQKFHTAVLAVDSAIFHDSSPSEYLDRWRALSMAGFRLAWQLRYSNWLPQEQGRCLMLGHHEMNMFNNRPFVDDCVLCYQVCNWIDQLRKGRTQDDWEGYEYPAEHLETLNLMYGGQLAREGRSRSESPGDCDDNGLGLGSESEIYVACDNMAGNESDNDRLETDNSGSSESESKSFGNHLSGSDDTRSDESESGTSGADEEEEEEEDEEEEGN